MEKILPADPWDPWKSQALVPLQTSHPAPWPRSFSAAGILAISLVQAAAALVRESGQGAT